MMSDQKRVTMKHKHPNPLFEQWLIEWRDKAKENDSKMQYCFSLALTTLRKYPLPLESGKDCKILKGFGEKLCKMLDDKLKNYKQDPKSNLSPNKNIRKPSTPRKNSNKEKNHTPSSSFKEYLPQHRSGPYAIMIALYEHNLESTYPGFSTKNEIIKKGQALCDVSFTKSGPDTRYTGWSSMKTLLQKNLVSKEGNPAKFKLTDEGKILADKLYIQHKIDEFSKEDNEPSTSKTSPKKNKILVGAKNKQTSSNLPSTSTSSGTHETIIMAPNSFEIILLVDTQELNGSKGSSEKDQIIVELENLNVLYEIRNLKVGDYVWICRDTTGSEIVLPYIIERKRMDDLGSSIKDSRFHEQKFRLKQSGITNLIYLIESYGKNVHVGLPITTLYQAATNTLVQDGFCVKFTDDCRNSCEYLGCMSEIITRLYKGKTVVSCPKESLPKLDINDDMVHLMLFNEFNKASSKSRVNEMFTRQLLQIKGMSVDKALAITEKYQSPKALKLQYDELAQSEGEKLLSTVPYGPLKKNVGIVLSKTVYQLFTRNVY